MVKDNRTSIESDLNRHHVRYEDPLWSEDQEQNVSKVISVNIVYSKKNSIENGCEWNICISKKAVLTIPSQGLTKKQIAFLQTPEGFQFLLQKFKQGCNTASKMKAEIKNFDLPPKEHQ